MTDINGFLMGGGGASAKFDQVGDSITGTVQTAEVQQQTDIQSGAPLTWDDGSPRMQLVVTLGTDLRDASIENDDGSRRLYVKGSKKQGSQSLHDAVASAVRASGAKGLEPGGRLTVTFAGTEPSQTRGFNDRKKYSAQYTAPDKAAATGDYLGTNPAPQQAPPAPAAPPQQAPAAPAPSAEEIAAFQQWKAGQAS